MIGTGSHPAMQRPEEVSRVFVCVWTEYVLIAYNEPMKKWGKRILIAIVGLCAVALVVSVGNLGNSLRLTQKARAEALEGYESSTASQRYLEATRQTMGADPVYSLSRLECELGHRDSGWMVQSYQNICKIMSTDVYLESDIAGEAAAAIAQIKNQPETDLWCNNEFEYITNESNYSYRMTLTYVPTASEKYLCQQRGVPKIPDYNENRVVQKVLSEKGISPRENFVAFDFEETVSSTDLGCRPIKVIFCNEPIKKPVLPKVETTP